jgi:hypothetical protein
MISKVFIARHGFLARGVLQVLGARRCSSAKRRTAFTSMVDSDPRHRTGKARATRRDKLRLLLAGVDHGDSDASHCVRHQPDGPGPGDANGMIASDGVTPGLRPLAEPEPEQSRWARQAVTSGRRQCHGISKVGSAYILPICKI